MPPETPRDWGMITQEAREAYVVWYMESLITANLAVAEERKAGTAWEGPRSAKDIIQHAGPGGITPDEATVYRWLKSDWAKPIIQKIVAEANQVCQVGTTVVWPLIVQNLQHEAIYGRGRDAVLAAKYLNDLRSNGVGDETSPLGRIIAGLVSGGRYDGEVVVKEQLSIRLERIRQLAVTVPAAGEITV